MFTTNPADAPACQGTNATFTAAATGDPATLTYQWYRQLSGSSTAEAIGGNSTTTTVVASGPMTVWAVATSGTASTASACAAVTIASVPTISGTTVRKYAGGRYTLTVSVAAEEAADVEYHWYEGRRGNTAVYLGQASYYINVYPMTLPSYYWVRVKNYNTGCFSDAEFETR